MSDKLAEFINDYNTGRISLVDLERRLSFDQWKNDKVKPLVVDYIEVPRNPLDIIVEEETQIEKIKLFLKLRRSIEPDDWKIVSMIARGTKQENIANAIGRSQSYVSKKFAKIRQIMTDMGFKELLQSDENIFEATTPQIKLQYPMDAMRTYTDDDGKVRCHVPEYLCETKCLSYCTLCDNCTVLKKNKRSITE